MFSTVIVPLDGSQFAEAAIAPASSLSAHGQTDLLLVRVHERPHPGPRYGRTWDEFFRSGEEAYLEELACYLRTKLAADVDRTLLDGDVATAVCGCAESYPNSIIVMSTHGRTGLPRVWLGSVADEILRKSRRPVMMLRPPMDDREPAEPDRDAPFANVIAALDGSSIAETALPHAISVAAALGARLELLRIVVPIAAQVGAASKSFGSPINPTELHESARRSALAYLSGIRSRTHHRLPTLEIGVHVGLSISPAEAILDYARLRVRPLIAMATHGRGVSRLLLGSTADGVLRGAPFAVLMCRSRN